MGCACKANQQITFLQKRYGENAPQSKISGVGGRISASIKKSLLVIVSLPIAPIILLISLIKKNLKKEKAININQLFKISN